MDNRMPIKTLLPLAGLTCSAFVFNTSEFIPIGLLSDIAADFGMTTASTGMLISVYAWMVMLLSLPLMVVASRMELRRLMLTLVGFFTLFQVMSFMSTSYAMLMASRIGVACTHSVFWSIVSPMAARMVEERWRPLALSIVATGSSVAMIFGMPIGRMIGLRIGWRMTFLSIGIVGAITFIYMLLTLTKLPSRGRFSVKKLPALVSNRPLMGIFILSLFFATSYYTGYSYIEPFLKHITGMHESLITTTLMIFGGAGIIGSIVFTKYYTAHRFGFLSTMLWCMAACLALILPTSFSIGVTIAVMAIWGMAATAFNVAMQSEIISIAPPEGTSVAMSIFSGIFNCGIGTGAFLGGLVCTHASLSQIGIAGCAIALMSIAYWRMKLSVYLHRVYE